MKLHDIVGNLNKIEGISVEVWDMCADEVEWDRGRRCGAVSIYSLDLEYNLSDCLKALYGQTVSWVSVDHICAERRHVVASLGDCQYFSVSVETLTRDFLKALGKTLEFSSTTMSQLEIEVSGSTCKASFKTRQFLKAKTCF